MVVAAAVEGQGSEGLSLCSLQLVMQLKKGIDIAVTTEIKT